MQTMLLRVVSSGEMISVKSEKSENGVLNKRILRGDGAGQSGNADLREE